MGLEVTALEKAYIVGRDHRTAAARRQRDGGMHVFLIIDATGALQFEIKAIREDTHPIGQQLIRPFGARRQQRDTNLPLLGCRQGDHALAGLGNPLPTHRNNAVALTLGIATRDQLGEIAVALGVHRQQTDAGQHAVVFGIGQPQINAGNRLDATAHRRLVELDQAAHVALVGNRHRRHARLGNSLDQGFDLDQSVDQGVLTVDTQVNKGK